MTETSLRVADRTSAVSGRAEFARHQGAAIADVPALEPTEGGPAQRFAQALSGRHPVTVFLVASILGYLLLAALTIALGLLLTEVVLRSGGVATTDERFVGWLAYLMYQASLIGSIIAGGVVIPIVVGVVAVVLACFKRWRIAAFLIAAITVEAATYRSTTWVVHRDRPQVPPPRAPTGERELPVRPYRRRPRRLRWARTGAHVARSQHMGRRRLLDDCACDTAFRGTGPHVPRDAPPARHPRRDRDRHRRAARRAFRRPPATCRDVLADRIRSGT